MFYRKAEVSDAEELAKLRREQLKEEYGTDAEIDSELSSYFTDGLSDGTLVVWLAEDNGTIIATAGVCFFRYPPTFANPKGKTAYITNVYTKEPYRRQGIATKLVEYVMKEIQAAGCGIIRLHSSAQGREMYRRLGFGDTEGFMAKRI